LLFSGELHHSLGVEKHFRQFEAVKGFGQSIQPEVAHGAMAQLLLLPHPH